MRVRCVPGAVRLTNPQKATVLQWGWEGVEEDDSKPEDLPDRGEDLFLSGTVHLERWL